MDKQTSCEKPIDPWSLAELSCWTAVLLAPILTWINGPSVSTDQFVVRSVTFGLVLTGGIGLRIRSFVRGRNASKNTEVASQDEST